MIKYKYTAQDKMQKRKNSAIQTTEKKRNFMYHNWPEINISKKKIVMVS